MILEFPKSIKIKPDSLEEIKGYFVKFKYLEENVDLTNIIIAEINEIMDLINTIHVWKNNRKLVNVNLKKIKTVYHVLQEAYDGYDLKEEISEGTNYKKVFVYTNSESEDIKKYFNVVYDYKMAHYIYIDFVNITPKEAYNLGVNYEKKNIYYTNLDSNITVGISKMKIKSEEQFISLIKEREK